MEETLAPRAKLRDRLRDQVHAAILDAAEQVIASQGVEEAHIDAIAVQAGVSVGTLYNHFGDRDGLVLAVVERLTSVLQADLHKVVDAPALTLQHDLVRFITVAAAHARRHGKFMTVLMDEGPSKRAWTCRRNEHIQQVRWLVARLVGRGTHDGLLRALPEEVVVAMLMATVHAAMMSSLRRPDAPLDPEVLVDALLNGISGPKAPSTETLS